jgi:hypothetical protein
VADPKPLSQLPFSRRSTTVSLTQDQHEDLRLIAERRLGSISQVVRTFVAEGVRREKADDDE